MVEEKLQFTGPAISVDKPLHDLVLEASFRYPDHVAVIFDGCTDGFNTIQYTYSQLRCMSSWIQKILVSRDYCEEVIGVLCLDQPTLPAWLTGILSTPAAFLPLASDITTTRIRNLINRLHVRVILTDSIRKQKIEQLIPDLINVTYNIRDLMNDMVMDSSVNIIVPDYMDLYFVILKTELFKWIGSSQEKKLAYVITTSGTTGLPKIVRVPHQCILSNIMHISELYKLSSLDYVYQASPLTFDPSIVEIFTTLKSGATLVLFPEDIRTHPKVLANYLSAYHVTVIQATPSLISSIGAIHLSKTLLSKSSSLKVLALGGERCPSFATISNWRAKDNQTCIINLYGITEVSSWAMYHILSEQDERRPGIPLGQPLYNTVIYIEISNDAPGKADDIGQIYIGGSSRSCIIDNIGDDYGAYNTSVMLRASGDLVRQQEGCLYYIGRTDEQIKYSGKRINLTEIEYVCEQHPGVQKASVLFDHAGLHLFVVLCNNDCQIGEVERFLKERLTRYSLPTDTTALSKMPLTLHGKIDKAALLKEYHKEQVKAKLSTLWKHHTQQSLDIEVLPQVRFTDCGGDSLSAIRFVNIIETKIIGYCLPNNRLLDILLNSDFGSMVNCVYDNLYGNGDATRTSHGGATAQVLDVTDNQRAIVSVLLAADKETLPDGSRSKNNPMPSIQNAHTESGSKIKIRSVSDDSVNVLQNRKRLKYNSGNVNSVSGANTTVCYTCSTDVLSVSHMSQIQIHNEHNVTRIELESLYDVCSLKVQIIEAWKFNMGKCVDSSPLIVVTRSGHATAYIGSHSKHCTLAAVNINDGKQLWSVSLCTRIEAAPSLSKCGQYVVVGAYDYNIYIFEASTGVLYWKYTTSDQVKDTACVNPINGLVYIGSHDHNVYCLDIQARHCLWQVKMMGCVFASPCLSVEPYHLYVATTKGNIYCLNPDFGDIVWHISLDSPVFSSPAVTPDGICIGTVSHVMYLLTHNAEKLWSYQCDGPIFSSPCLYNTHKKNGSSHQVSSELNQTAHPTHNCLFYCVFGCHSSDVLCLNDQGTLLWQHKMSSQVYSSPFIISNGYWKRPLVVVCCTSGDVHVLDLETGQLLGHKHIMGGEIFSSPVVWNDKIIIGCRDNNVYCLKINLCFEHFLC